MKRVSIREPDGRSRDIWVDENDISYVSEEFLPYSEEWMTTVRFKSGAKELCFYGRQAMHFGCSQFD